jgi:hypothetical protein
VKPSGPPERSIASSSNAPSEETLNNRETAARSRHRPDLLLCAADLSGQAKRRAARLRDQAAVNMRELAAERGGVIEDKLTATLAKYLFDHGLNPLTQPMIGPARPDLLGADQHYSFYVEQSNTRGAPAPRDAVWSLTGSWRRSASTLAERSGWGSVRVW